MSNPQIDLGTVYKGSPSGKMVKAKGGTRELQPDEVVIDVSWSGLCGTDLHYRQADMVLGHEGVGKISQVGSMVKNVKVGDRVGWQYNHYGCNYCDACLDGYDVHCPESRMYGVADLDIGGFGDRAVLNSKFVHVIPDEIPLKYAAPLQCAGSTVYSAMENANVKAGQRIGLIGLGGLGHLAVQFLNKAGCDAVVFSATDSKKQQATELGAKEFVATNNNPKLEGVEPIDHLLVTTSAQPDWDAYFGVLKPEGQIIPLTVSFGEMTHPYMGLLIKQLNIHGTIAGRRAVHRRMLKFAAAKGVRPMIEVLPMNEEGINTAMERLAKGDVRYRFVLKSETNNAE